MHRIGLSMMLVLALISWSGHAQAASVDKPQTSNIDYLQRALSAYTAPDTVITKWATVVQSRFPVYQQWMQEAQRIGRRGVYRIDVILQRHEIPSQTLGQELQMYYSQLRVRQLLDSLDYQVIGAENIDLDRLTWSNLEQFVIAEHRDYYGPEAVIDTSYCQLILLRSIWRMNGLTYLEKHPNAMMLGTEDLPMHRLHMVVIRHLSSQPFYQPVDSATVDLFWALVRARSELAMVKTLRTMAQRFQVRGAIVIGLGHEPEMADITKRYHLQSRIYRTELPARLPPDWWK